MADKRDKRSLAREGEPSQKTDKGLEIPVPEAEEFFGLLDKATKKPQKKPRAESQEKPSRPDQERP
jgi:hypothetical protein